MARRRSIDPPGLDDARACVNAAAYHAAQIALFSAENILPVWLVTQELKRVRHKLTRASQFLVTAEMKMIGRTVTANLS